MEAVYKKKLLKPVATQFSLILTRLMKLMDLFLKIRCYTTELLCTEKNVSSDNQFKVVE